MKPGDPVVWVYSPRHSILDSWRVEKIPGEIIRIGKRRIQLRVWHRGEERCVNVDPDNVFYEAEGTTDFTNYTDFSAGEHP